MLGLGRQEAKRRVRSTAEVQPRQISHFYVKATPSVANMLLDIA